MWIGWLIFNTFPSCYLLFSFFLFFFVSCQQCLRKDAESRRRELHIRTYAVIPLNDECGIIEWVNNTAGLRNILIKLYKEKGKKKKNNYVMFDWGADRGEDREREGCLSLDMVLGYLLLGHGSWTRWPPEFPSNLSHSVVVTCCVCIRACAFIKYMR